MLSYQKALEDRKESSLLRILPQIDPGIDFFSNDYLGLARSEAYRELLKKDFDRKNQLNGATGSRLLSGNNEFTEAVENKIAQFHNCEAALIYSSGFTANLGLISSLATRETTLFMDELCHASLIDGARLGKSTRVRFKHNDPTDLQEKLQKSNGQKLVIVESVYSMDGDICPLEEITKICNKQSALLVVDEAHGVGVYGKKGGGLVSETQLEEEVFARIVTYGKAPGIHGASVLGPKWLKEYQVNFSRPFIFSTAPSPHQISSISSFYDFIPHCENEKATLKENINFFIEKRKKHGGKWLNSSSQIQSLIIPGNEAVIKMGNKLKEAKINALPIRKPSVPEGEERIRFCLHSYNTKEEIELLFEIL